MRQRLSRVGPFHVSLLCLWMMSCGGHAPSPITPSPLPTPTPSSYTFGGTVQDAISGQGLTAHLSVNGLELLTNPDGHFTLTTSDVHPVIAVSSDGYVTRRTSLPNAELDLIPSSFLSTYRQVVRDGYDHPNALQPIIRWNAAPQFYISRAAQTTDADVTRAQEGIVAAMTQMTPFGMPHISNGAPAADRDGWITLDFDYAPNSSDLRCGYSNGHGHITIRTAGICQTTCPLSSERVIPWIVAHEVGHALGFYHDQQGVMNATAAPATCGTDVTFSQAEQQAARIMARRAVGNVDPDTDPN